eukprot:gene1055-1390_t
MKGCLLIVAIVGLCLAQAAQGQSGTVLEWLDKNAKLFAQLVKSLDIKIPANTVATVLVPSDKAVEAFLSGMNLKQQEFVSRKALVDLVLAYHVIPGFQAKSADAIKKNPTISATADVNYILRFYREPGPAGKPAKVWVQDVQGNNVTVEGGTPIVLGKISVLKIDRVLMSGGYFFNGLDALKHYPQWSDAFALAEKAGWPTGSAAADLTMFVPDNKALTARKVADLDAATARQQLLYHFVAPARHIPDQLPAGKVPTLLKGHDLVVAITKKPGGVPDVTITPEVGGPAKVVIFNVYAGKGILQGIDGNLQAKLPGTVAAEAAPAVKPAAAATGVNGSLSAKSQVPHSMAAGNRTQAAVISLNDTLAVTNPTDRLRSQYTAISRVSLGRRLLLASPFGQLRGVRRVLLKRGYSDDGFNQMTANSIAASNTQQAINAAAEGNVPVSAATHYGSYQAQAAAEYNSDCWNCKTWVGR